MLQTAGEWALELHKQQTDAFCNNEAGGWGVLMNEVLSTCSPVSKLELFGKEN